MDPILICTDLDRTLLPNGDEDESESSMQRFCELVAGDDVQLCFVTGRDRKLVEDAITQYGLPRPDHVIADVGSTIFHLDGEDWLIDDAWSSQIAGDWRDHTNSDIMNILRDLVQLTPQVDSKQGLHKVSYDVPLPADTRELLTGIEQRLIDVGIESSLIWSIDDLEGHGLLDILPASASKRSAIEYLIRSQAHDITSTVFAGDSGNDIDVLISPVPSVLVANAKEEVRRESVRRAEEQGTLDSLYLATGDWYGMNGNYSAGILEGIAHYHPDTIERWK